MPRRRASRHGRWRGGAPRRGRRGSTAGTPRAARERESCGRWLAGSNDRPVGNHRVLGNDHDAVADVVVGAIAVARAHVVADAHPPTHPSVLVDDGVLDDAVGPDADTRLPLSLELLEVLGALVDVRSQDQAVADARALGDPAADTDHRPLDVRLLDERALGD